MVELSLDECKTLNKAFDYNIFAGMLFVRVLVLALLHLFRVAQPQQYQLRYVFESLASLFHELNL
jgi:hypothetical protein